MDLVAAVRIVEIEVREVEWRILGRELGLTDPELDNINHNYRSNGLQEIVHQMLFYWNQKHGSDATVEKLASALVLSGLWKLATVIHPGVENCLINQDYCKTLEASLSNEEKLALQDITTMLRQRYSNMQLSHFAWEEDTTLPLEELYVELSLCQMDKWDEVGTPIKIEEVFTMNQMPFSTKKYIKNRYLIEGAPGYGKTTMLNKIVYDWATEKFYVNDQFQLVIILSLRELEGTFNELFKAEVSVEGHSNSTIGTLLQKLQSRVLLLLDGYDELPPGKHDDLNRLLKGEQYPRMTIFLTSRLRYTDIVRTLGSFWNQRIEIKGISEKQRKEFLRKYLKVSPEVVEEKMSLVFKKPIDDLFECPLFLILIATVTEQQILDSISTKTQLYKIVFTFLVRRSLIRERLLNETNSFELFSYLNETRTEKFLRILWSERSYRYYHLLVLFGQFAVSMIKQSKLHFHRDEVLKICRNNNIFCLGFLMSTVKNNNRKRQTNYYEPVHKSFLEFLAALYLADLAKNNNRTAFTNEVQELVKSELQPESTVFLFSFLGGLLGNKAHWLLEDVIYISESKFSSTERQRIFQVISDMNASEELMKCVIRILPNCMSLNEYNNKHEARGSLRCGLIKTLECNFSISPTTLPAVDVESVVVNINLDKLFIEQQLPETITCERLLCNVYGNIFAHWKIFNSQISKVSAEKLFCYMWPSSNKYTEIFSSNQLIEMNNKIHSVTVMHATAIDLIWLTEFLRGCNSIRQLDIHFKSQDNIIDEFRLEFLSTVLAKKQLRNCVISVPSGKEMLNWREVFHIAVNPHQVENKNTPNENKRNSSLKLTLGCSRLEVADLKFICEAEIMDGLYFVDVSIKLGVMQSCLMKEFIYYDTLDLQLFSNLETVILTDMMPLSSIFKLNHPVLRLIVVYNVNLGDKKIEETKINEESYSKTCEFDKFHDAFMLTTSMEYKVSNEKSTIIKKSRDLTLKFFTDLLSMAYLQMNLELIKDAMLNKHIARSIVVCDHLLPNKERWTSSQFKSYLHRVFTPSLFCITEQLNEPLCMLETFPSPLTNDYHGYCCYEFYREYVITCNTEK